MIAALDTQIGQITNLPGFNFNDDILIVVGDNGTPSEVATNPDRAKTTTYTDGVRVPAFIRGKGIPQGQSQANVSICDLYATICELSGVVPPAGLDSRSLMPIVNNTALKVRDYCVAGIRGDAQYGHDDLGCWSLRYYYRRARTRASDGSTGPWVEEFYDLLVDPNCQVDLITSSDPSIQSKIVAHSNFLDQELP